MNETMLHTWLRQRLAGGPVSIRILRAEATAQGLNGIDLEKAATQLGMERIDAVWRLPGGVTSSTGTSAMTSTAQDVIAATTRERERCAAIIESEIGRKRPDLAAIHVKAGTEARPAIAAMASSGDVGKSPPIGTTQQIEPAAALFGRRRAQAGHGQQRESASAIAVRLRQASGAE